MYVCVYAHACSHVCVAERSWACGVWRWPLPGLFKRRWRATDLVAKSPNPSWPDELRPQVSKAVRRLGAAAAAVTDAFDAMDSGLCSCGTPGGCGCERGGWPGGCEEGMLAASCGVVVCTLGGSVMALRTLLLGSSCSSTALCVGDGVELPKATCGMACLDCCRSSGCSEPTKRCCQLNPVSTGESTGLAASAGDSRGLAAGAGDCRSLSAGGEGVRERWNVPKPSVGGEGDDSPSGSSMSDVAG